MAATRRKPQAKTKAKPKPKAKPEGQPAKANELIAAGQLPGPGRPKGKPNKLTADMKTMIEQAAQVAGANTQKRRPDLKGLEPGVAYLAEQAHRNPVAFMGLMRGLLPAKIDLDVTVMSRDMVTMLSQRREQLAKLRDITPTEED